MEKLCDLHTHSTASDGSVSPSQLPQMAVDCGLSAIVLCDHNTVAGLPEFLEGAKGLPVEAIPGIEFSTEFEDTELHILALYIRPEHYPQINAVLEDFQRRKAESNVQLVAALKNAGIVIDYDALLRQHSYINRAHIAQALTGAGYTESVKDAFKKYLHPEKGYYIPPKRPDAFETIQMIKSFGAVAVLAHPFLNLDEAGLRRFLPEAKARGLDAMETLYSKYDPETTALAKKIAEEYGILESGGSDFHGTAKPDIQLGTGRGELRISCELLELLKGRKK